MNKAGVSHGRAAAEQIPRPYSHAPPKNAQHRRIFGGHALKKARVSLTGLRNDISRFFALAVRLKSYPVTRLAPGRSTLTLKMLQQPADRSRGADFPAFYVPSMFPLYSPTTSLCSSAKSSSAAGAKAGNSMGTPETPSKDRFKSANSKGTCRYL